VYRITHTGLHVHDAASIGNSLGLDRERKQHPKYSYLLLRGDSYQPNAIKCSAEDGGLIRLSEVCSRDLNFVMVLYSVTELSPWTDLTITVYSVMMYSVASHMVLQNE
jgi:hypothetical protein